MRCLHLVWTACEEPLLQLQPITYARKILRFAEPARQHPFAIEDPIQLPHSPSGFDPGDRFNLHKSGWLPFRQGLTRPIGNPQWA